MADILRDNVQHAEHSPLVINWTGGVWNSFANLGMASPFSGGVAGTLDFLGLEDQSFQEMPVRQGLHMSP